MYHSVVKVYKIAVLSFSKFSFKVASAYMLPQSSDICLQKVVNKITLDVKKVQGQSEAACKQACQTKFSGHGWSPLTATSTTCISVVVFHPLSPAGIFSRFWLVNNSWVVANLTRWPARRSPVNSTRKKLLLLISVKCDSALQELALTKIIRRSW